MRLRDVRLLAIIDGEVEDGAELLRKIRSGEDVTDIVTNEQNLELTLIGAAQQMYTCISCGATFDIDDDMTDIDTECEDCGEGPFCEDCKEVHDCNNDHELPVDDI